MKLLETIQFKNLSPAEIKNMKLRRAARAVLFDNSKKMALLYVSKLDYHKLPGGGIEKGENILSALKRECLEETGCHIKIRNELGLIIEYRTRFDLKQKSYCYIAEVEGTKGKPEFDKGEKNEGFKLLWTDLDESINLIAQDAPDDYEGKFIIKRDKRYLMEAKNLLNSK